MSKQKCANCGLVNFAAAAECKRCAAPLGATWAVSAADASEALEAHAAGEEVLKEGRRRRSLLTRAAAVLCATLAALVVCHGSLLWTSRAATVEQRIEVRRAVDIIERGGFRREAFLLGRVTSFRTSDNWWNNYAGHEEAYASTNFPFEVVTLYYDFFHYPGDDVERAVILLHEARHLAGADEAEACDTVWRDKARLGWTRERYGDTRVWQNVTELSRRHAPALFTCGRDGRQDCYE